MSTVRAVQVLTDAEVDFVIIGGWSAILHGSSYITNDLDICYSRSRGNIERLASALAPFHPQLRDVPPGLPFQWDAATLRNGALFNLSTDLGPIDLLGEVIGLGDFDAVKQRSVRVAAFGRDVWTLDLRSLIDSKRASGRAKDLRLIPELESLLEAEQPE